MTVLALVTGLALLAGGGEALVRGGSGLGRTLGLSPLVVGLTVVAFATSAPEFAVSVDAALAGAPALAVGNVVGSNISNVLLVLGATALVLPVAVHSRVVLLDVPVMLGVSVVFLVVAVDGQIARGDGAVLLVALLGYLIWSVHAGSRGSVAAELDESVADLAGRRHWFVDAVLVAAGVALLVAGSELLVDAATEMAVAVGVSELVIGLTVVAVGTSLPELATSVIAAMRGDSELAIGNVVGSCVFNLGMVMGLTAVVSREGVPVAGAAVRFDVPVMVAVAGALLPVVFTGFLITRGEAVAFLGYYGLYVTYLLLNASDHPALPAFSNALAWFVVPLTAFTLLLLLLHEFRAIRGRSAPG